MNQKKGLYCIEGYSVDQHGRYRPDGGDGRQSDRSYHGFADLDARTSGLQKSDLIILAARPSMGKTAFVLNVAQNAAIKGDAKVLIFSLEMSKEQLGQRLLSIDSCVELAKLKTGDLSRGDWEDLNIAIDRLSKAQIYIDDTPGISVLEMKNKCRRLKAEKGLDLVIVDYLQLHEYRGKTEGRQQEVSALSRMLKQLAREMECPVIVLSQLSRAVEQQNGSPASAFRPERIRRHRAGCGYRNVPLQR